MGVKRQQVTIHIERLVLRGFAPGDSDGISSAIRQELRRLVASQGLPGARSTAVPAVNADAFRVARLSRTSTIGGQAARAIYGGLGR